MVVSFPEKHIYILEHFDKTKTQGPAPCAIILTLVLVVLRDALLVVVADGHVAARVAATLLTGLAGP